MGPHKAAKIRGTLISVGKALSVAFDVGETAGIIAQQFLLDQRTAEIEIESFMKVVVWVEQLAFG